MTRPAFVLTLLIAVSPIVLLSACDITEPEETRTEVWSGIATPAAHGAAAAVGASTSGAAAAGVAADTTWLVVFLERVRSETVYATLTIAETDPDPCDLWWLGDTGEPCEFMTKGEGIGVPFVSPETMVIDFTLPTLGACELAGPIDDDEWAVHLRCGEFKNLFYEAILSGFGGSSVRGVG